MGTNGDLLASCAVFENMGRGAAEAVAAVARRRELRAGERLFESGDPRVAFWVVVEGRIEIRVRADLGSRSLIVLGRGDVVGEAALLEGGSHTTSGVALESAVVLEVPVAELTRRLEGDAASAVELTARLARSAVRRLRFAAARSADWRAVYSSGRTRIEHDLLGEREVPVEALYGIQTLRAVENFSITGVPLAHFPGLIRALAMVKLAAARANARLGLLEPEVAAAIGTACQEIIDGRWHGHFVVDMVQGGAGTSTNMNANEVIANRALEILGRGRGEYRYCHPNNHVNLSQSTNDVYPTALRLAALMELEGLTEALRELASALDGKAAEFADVVKVGRTQLQDAVPMTVAQEIGGWAVTVREDLQRLEEVAGLVREINLGGTAIGTGINADPRYPRLAVDELSAVSDFDLELSPDLVEATQDTGAFMALSGVLKRTAVKLGKIANDLRLLSSGPRCGIGELKLPAVQPGSSIMPGKVNPVIPEVVNQVAFAVVGHDLTITMAAEAGQLQLNAMEPVIAFSLFQSIGMLTAAVRTLTQRCISGLEVDRERCRELVERSIGVVTALVPVLGYEVASRVATEALASGRSVREVVLERQLIPEEELDRLLRPEAMTRPRRLAGPGRAADGGPEGSAEGS